MKIIEVLNDSECVNTILSLHTSMYSMMTKIKCIFAKYNIKYTFAHGTLIGQQRNKNLLLWDDDIDYVIENDKLLVDKIQFPFINNIDYGLIRRKYYNCTK